MAKFQKTIIVFALAILVIGFSGAAWAADADAATDAAININTASVDQLATLKGIGPALAQRIVEYREANGDFKTVDDLKQVKGIGEKTLAKLSPSITVGGDATGSGE